MPSCSFVYGAGASANASCHVMPVAGNCSSVLRGTIIRMLLIVIVPPENRSSGWSTVAAWMKPTMSNDADAGSAGCAPMGTESAAATTTMTNAHPTLAPPARARERFVVVRISVVGIAMTPLCAHTDNHPAERHDRGPARTIEIV